MRCRMIQSDPFAIQNSKRCSKIVPCGWSVVESIGQMPPMPTHVAKSSLESEEGEEGAQLRLNASCADWPTMGNTTPLPRQPENSSFAALSSDKSALPKAQAPKRSLLQYFPMPSHRAYVSHERNLVSLFLLQQAIIWRCSTCCDSEIGDQLHRLLNSFNPTFSKTIATPLMQDRTLGIESSRTDRCSLLQP